MPMQKKLWPVNALATELARDRRIVAKMLDGVRPDGKIQGHSAWYLDSALAAMNGRGSGRDDRTGTGVVTTMLERVMSWDELRAESPAPGIDFGIDDLASIMSTDRTTVLRWLKAGMP